MVPDGPGDQENLPPGLHVVSDSFLNPPSTPVSALVSVGRGEAASEAGWRSAGCARRPQFTVVFVQDALWRGIHSKPDKREVGTTARGPNRDPKLPATDHNSGVLQRTTDRLTPKLPTT